jgi:hypothetical protein
MHAKKNEDRSYELPDIFIDREGTWFADGMRVIHKKILSLFCSSLYPDGRGGYHLCINGEECPVRVEDTPFVIKRFLPLKSGAGEVVFTLLLNDDSIEDFYPETLSRSGDTSIYCLIRNNTLRARFGRECYPDLIHYLQYDENEKIYYFTIGSKRYPILEKR